MPYPRQGASPYPRYAPEWLSGGIFSLKEHRGVLFYVKAFEAEAWVHVDDRVGVYRFERVGEAPRSGGDTYNAVAAVDDFIFFGGWVHAPVEVEDGRINFRNKYSHVHRLDVREMSIKLLWKEGIGSEDRWAGEVSEIIYDPINDRLLLARGDGHERLGVYKLRVEGGHAHPITETPCLKGTIYLDHACFDIVRDWGRGVEGIQCIDLLGDRVTETRIEYQGISIDGGGVYRPLPCATATAYGRLLLFVKGGVVLGNPLDGDLRFYRLLDFGRNMYSCYRCNALPYAGGILIGFNALSYAVIRPQTETEKEEASYVDTPVAQSLLVYIAPPTARIVAAFGARITSLEHSERGLLVATNTEPNLAYNVATRIDQGYKQILVLPHNVINQTPPPLEIVVRKRLVGSEAWGGIPLTGYKRLVVTVKSGKPGKLHVYSYTLTDEPGDAIHTVYRLRRGVDKVEIETGGIVSFRLEGFDEKTVVKLTLIP